MKSEFTFTVFTATYNRANTLSRVYNGLRLQSFRDFEWLIVDDGSTDDTKVLIEQWRSESDFPIRYFWQENRGKHTAFNRGVREAKGELFLSIDSDDACVSKALERFKHHWDAIPITQRENFSAVTALAMDPSGVIVGDKFPKDMIDSDSLEIYYRFKIRGDKWGFHRTDVLRMFPFPESDGVRFVNENVVWFAISRRYKTRFVNEPLLTIFAKESGEANQLTKVKPTIHVEGRVISHQFELNHTIDWFIYAPMVFLKLAANYARYSCHAGIPLLRQLRGLDNKLAKLLWGMCLPLGRLLYIKDKFSS